MTRLPRVGGDEGSWGQILNDYLSVSHDGTGNITPDAVTAAGAVTGENIPAAIADAVLTDAGVAGALDQTHQRAISALKYVPAGVDSTTTDVSAYVQRVIDEAAASGGDAIVWWPAHVVIAEIQLKSNVRIIGSTQGRSVIKAVPGSTNKGIIMLNSAGGAISRVSVENLSISGNGNVGQWGMYLKSQPPTQGTDTGHGLWYSSFRNLRITNTYGGGIWLYGGGADSMGPHQFLNFDQVSIQLTAGTYPNWIGILCSGQVGQIVWNQIESSYRGTGFGAQSLYIAREMNDSMGNVSDTACYSMTFNSCTWQGSTVGVSIERAESISFFANWFEDNQSGVHVGISSFGTTLISCSFHDSSNNGGNGYIGLVDGNSTATVINPSMAFSGTHDYIWSDNSGTGFLKVIGGRISDTGPFGGMPKQMSAAATINIGSNTYIAITGATTINTLSTTLDHGELLVVRTLSAINISGSAGNVRFPTGWGTGTLSFENNSRLVLHHDKGAGIFTLISANTSATRAGAFEQIRADGSGYLGMQPQSATPATPATGARFFVRTNASSKIEFCMLTPDGAVVVLGTQA